MTTTAPARVLVVDDEPSILDAVATALRYEGHEVHEADNGLDAVISATTARPDLIVLDVMLPDLDGFEVCRRLRAAGIDIPVLFLTARDEVDDRVQGLRLGADDYLTKPFSLAELAARIEAILRRTRVDAGTARADGDDLLHFEDVLLDAAAHTVTRGGRPIRLTATEFRLLRYFLENPRRVLSKTQILDAVWDYGYDGDPNLVETYVRYLRRKLDAAGPPLIHTIRLVGYVLRSDAP